MEPKIEPWMHLAAIKIVEHFNEARSGFQFGMAWENSTQLIIARNFPRVPSSPAPRLEFQADRMTDTEWSADTWLVLPNGKRKVLGWIPCDSQEEADREVATLKKLYAEAVPSSPAAQKRTLVQQNLVIAAEIHCAMTDQECIPFEGERYFPALSTQKLERILGFHAPPDESIVVQLLRTELLQYSEEVKHLREQLDSPAAPTPPTIAEALREHWLSMIECLHDSGTDKAHCACGVWVSKPQPNVGEAVNRWIEHVFRSVGQEARKTSESSSRTDVPLQSGIPEKVEQTGSKCSMSSPCGEIVAKGVCDACNKLHKQGFGPDGKTTTIICIGWRHTHNVCLGCGREEPV